jgi:tetratricopeptide (TPR) repeat protein
LGEYDAAEEMLREVLAIDRATLGEDHPQHASTLRSLGGLQAQARRYQAAERTFRDAIEIELKSFAEDSWQVATTESMLGDCLIRMGRHGEAEPLVVRSFDIIRAEFGDEHGRTQAALGRVITLYEALGNSRKAAEYRALLPSG